MNEYCPLCQKYLIMIGSILQCPQRVHFSNGYQSSHFTEHNGENMNTWCIPPYLIVNYLDKNISKVYITKSFESSEKRAYPIWEDLFQTELISPGDTEKLKKKIKLLTIFS